MFETLYKYLIINQKLGFPGMGSFIVERLPVEHDYANKKLYAPLPVIRWQQEITAPDQAFYRFLASSLVLNEVNAIGQFNDFSYQLKETIAQQGSADLPGIGKLKKEFANTYSFEPAYSLETYFPPVTAEYVPLLQNGEAPQDAAEAANTVMKKIARGKGATDQNWWIYAIILAAIGIAGLVYHILTSKV